MCLPSSCGFISVSSLPNIVAKAQFWHPRCLKKLIKSMGKLFKKDELSEAYETFSDFERFKWILTMWMDTYTYKIV